ncbi:MAG: hypothetical protein GZ091_05880 [Paludibacter sp.]|nr:hypothetical protein [Paludibacter sp.]
MEENNSKEINLLQLIALVFGWFKKTGNRLIHFFVEMLRISFRHKISLIILVVICVAIGQYMARKSVRTYNADAMVMIYGSDAQTVKEVSKQLENSLSSNKLISLATKLSLPDSIAKNIASINSYYVIDYMRDSVADKIDFKKNHSLTDTVNVRMRDRIYLRMQIKSIAQVPQVQTALLNFFNNNNVLKSQFGVKKNEYIQQIRLCDLELKRIDSLASISYFKENEKQLRFDNNRLLIGEQHKQLFYGELLRLQEIKSVAEFKLSNYNQPIEIPASFVVNPVPLNGRVKYGVYGIIIGYFLALFLALITENYKKTLKFLNS